MRRLGISMQMVILWCGDRSAGGSCCADFVCGGCNRLRRSDTGVNPGATEVQWVDDDCDTLADDDDPGVDLATGTTYFEDDDRMGLAMPRHQNACDVPLDTCWMTPIATTRVTVFRVTSIVSR